MFYPLVTAEPTNLPKKLQDDIMSLVNIAYTRGSIRSITILHWLNERNMPNAYSDVVDFLQNY